MAPGGPDQAFADSMLQALRQWQNSPAGLDGVPVTCEVLVIVTFEASRDSGEWFMRTAALGSNMDLTPYVF